ncbi:hypothetical protein HMPREF9714_01420 [Myroides odoratimimus CCUG 12901]|uniref:hypothetical protein n=1 Tax=Myroides odoratimimus TaxID=76832 RepID=UPI000246093E|nr:hypothetical protein [Myroides odoratimimus]EHO10991.1 hypothetical protein HMPREF9714_01420 [Myroides odoratimimus CCUG 12901]MDM1412483.1 hypothetical protein [Myroides odoratimimus]
MITIYNDFIENHTNYAFFDPEKVKEFLDLPIVYSLDSILPAFNRELGYNEICNIRTILNYKYREQRNNLHPYLAGSLETVITESFVNLFGDKSEVIDCAEFEGDVKKVSLVACRKCKKVSTKPNLEMLIIDTMPKMTEIVGLSTLLDLKDLTISRTPKFTNFDAIKALKNVLFLNLTHCKTIENIDFLTEEHNLIFLDLSFCPNLDLARSIPVLKKLKNIKHINISVKKKELPLVLEELPHVYINSYKFKKED